jgi:hypothetical protein
VLVEGSGRAEGRKRFFGATQDKTAKPCFGRLNDDAPGIQVEREIEYLQCRRRLVGVFRLQCEMGRVSVVLADIELDRLRARLQQVPH